MNDIETFLFRVKFDATVKSGKFAIRLLRSAREIGNFSERCSKTWEGRILPKIRGSQSSAWNSLVRYRPL